MDKNYLRIRLTHLKQGVRLGDNIDVVEACADTPELEPIYLFEWDGTHFHNVWTGGSLVSIDEIFYLELLFNDEPRRDPTFTYLA